jgi:arginine deiminase
VGALRAVLVHRPHGELRSVAADPQRALFAAPVSDAEAAAEHDDFVVTLSAQGVEVLYLQRLLTEVTRDRRRAELFSHWLPNLMYPRDPSVWIGHGVALGAMAMPLRRRESDLFARVYRDHPRFAGAARWMPAGTGAPIVEGGDVLLAGAGRVIVGASSRTTSEGAARVARALIGTGAAAEVAILEVPHRAGFHLDLAMTMVDRDKVAIRRGLRRQLRGWLWRPHRSAIRIDPLSDPLMAFPEPVEPIELEQPRSPGDPLSWDHGINVLAVSPGRVISYAHNERSNERLSAAGIDVIPIRGSALARGRGGPRCLTCPVSRDP